MITATMMMAKQAAAAALWQYDGEALSPLTGTETNPRLDIPWNHELSLGIPEIDKAHEECFDLIDDFMGSVDDNAPLETMRDKMIAAINRTIQHFSAEEHLMAMLDYPFIEDHQRQHACAADEFTRLLSHDVDTTEAVALFRDLLPRWTMYHLKTSDQHFADWIRMKTTGPAGAATGE